MNKSIIIMQILTILIALPISILATDVNGRFVVMGTDNNKLELLVQVNTNTGTDDMGGATIVLGFNSSINISSTPVKNVDYIFHNFNGGNYSPATITKPASDKIWLNIDLPYNNNNNGLIVKGGNEWTDVATIFFNINNPNDTIRLSWMTLSPFWGVYDGDNISMWNTGLFQNLDYLVQTDFTSPQLLDAIISDSTRLELIFSEPMESSLAHDISNYSINNGVLLNGASLSINQNKVTLYTSPHVTGLTYTVLVSNLTDLAGNLISFLNNSADYLFFSDVTPPEIINVTPTNTQSVTVKFSERLDHLSAKNKNNYTISNNITINSVQLLPDSCSVLLKTTKQSPEVLYTLTANNIKDRSGNNMNQNSQSYLIPKRIKGPKDRNTFAGATSNSWSQLYFPENTIDGQGMTNTGSRWQSGKFMPASIYYDFGDSKPIDSIRISFYKWEAGRKYQYSVYTSDDSITWAALAEEMWSEEFEWTDLMIDSINARYLRLDLLESNQSPFASIWEIETYGLNGPNIIEDQNDISVPSNLILEQNYPNPFNPNTKISWQSPVSSHHTLKVYDVLGDEVAILLDEFKAAGSYEVNFEANNLASGVYIYRLSAGVFTETRKMVLLR